VLCILFLSKNPEALEINSVSMNPGRVLDVSSLLCSMQENITDKERSLSLKQQEEEEEASSLE